MGRPSYKGIDSIPKITSWFLKNDKTLKSNLWKSTEARNELNNRLVHLFQTYQQSDINEKINILFHEFTYIYLPKLEEWRQKNVNPKEQEDYLNLLTLVLLQNAQLRISGWIYQQIFKEEFSPFGNPFLILGYFDGFIDYYRVLGLSSTCTSEDIKKAYRTKVKIHHPDVGGDPEVFKQLKEANDVLSDEQQRNAYNEKYEYYQRRYDYNIKSSQMVNHSTYTTKNERPRWFIRFHWKPFLFVVSAAMLLSILSPLIKNDIAEPAKTETKEQNQSNHSLETDSDMGLDTQDSSEDIYTQKQSDDSEIPAANSLYTSVDTDSFFTLGSTKDDVLNVMGDPDEIEEFGYVSSWRYIDSSIEFDENGLVAGWSNYSGVLKVSVGTKREGAIPFTKGSTKDEVVNVMGTPDEVTHWGAIWHYQNSTVEFSEETVFGWSDESGILFVK
ncbi:J domain-containing protein [Mesobacillus maritimus]|uniref:J domain-containing protein n=1 Tax=Mesobacillus maritimus TaxID=1643336 RepID=UPI00384DA865